MPVSGEELYTIVVRGSIPDIVVAVNEFKAFVKKEFVDISQVPKYLEALCISVDHPNAEVSSSSFSVLAHLVKRVSMQDHTGKALQAQSFLVLPVILKRMGDAKSSVRATAKKSLEAYWFLAPQDVEMAVKDIALASQNAMVIQELVDWLLHIVVNVSQLFKLEGFMPSLVALVRGGDMAVCDEVKKLLVEYYSLKHNHGGKQALVRELTSGRAQQRFIEAVVGEIERKLGGIPEQPLHFVNAGTAKVTVGESKKKSQPMPKTTGGSTSMETSTTFHPAITDSDPALLKILSKLSTYKLDTSSTFKPMQIASSSALYDQIYQMSLPFEGKETEFNWGQRERNIVQLRCIIRGNTPTDFRNEFITCLKEVSESICKAVLSLRTTLSTHGCQLIKECAIILGADFDPLIDNYMPTLSKLTLATKNIASTNANIAICSMYANCSFHTKLIHRVQQSSVEKNYQPRSYSGIWIQILLVRFSSNSQFSSDSCTKVITKLLSDQNPTVRQVAKDTFWIHWQKFPAQGEAMLGRLDGNIVRALERSRPKQTAPPTATSTSSSSVSDTAASKARSKPSIRESIILKNRELKEKQRAQTLSRPSSNLDFHNPPSHSQHELKNQRSSSSLSFNRLGGAKRNFTYDPSSTSSHSLSGGNSTISKNNRVASVGVQSTSKQPSFDIQADPILKFLSSDLLEEKLEGISLLKYAILGDEELSNQISVLITKISLKNPMLLKPLFLGSNELLRKTFKYFESPEDFIRVICILRTEVDASQVDLITSFVLCEEVYQSFAAILSYATKITNILNNGDLVMQMIRYKTTIFQTSIQFLNLSLERMPISDASYSLLIQELFEMVNLLRSTNPFNSLIELLTKFNNINHELFERNLQKTSISIRDELKQSLNRIDASTSRLEVPDLQSEKTSYDMTRVFLQPDSQPQASPLKEPSDFTMIMPTFNKNEFVFEEKKLKLSPTNLDAEPQFDTVVEDNIDMDDDSKDETCGAEINNNNQDHIQNHDDNMEVDDNIFVEKNESNGRRSDLFAKFNKETSTELVNDFAQVQICEPMVSSSATRDDNPIQSFIDRLDPLNKISNKKKQIQIYHDESDKSCSPQKQRDYNYGEMNWFNYLVAKARADSTTSPATTSSISSGDSERSIENFKSLCSNLSLSKIQSRNFIEILNYLQDRKHSATVKVFIDSQGHALLEDSLWKFFDKQTSSTLNPNFLLSGLIVLKQMLVNRLYLNLEKLWSNILLLNEICGTSQLDSTASTEIDIAINEVFDEILVGSFSSQEILSIFSSSFNNINGFSQHKLIFVLESFNKLVSMNTFGFLITDQIIAHVDNSLRRYLSNESVVTRRTVVLIYGKLLKADRTIEVNKMENSNEKNVMENILQNLTVPQKKLIEYYSQQ